MNTNWDDLKYLLALSQTGTLAAAAERLGTNATTVSRRIKRLEAEFGFPLFERSGDGWSATLASVELIDTARQIHRSITRTQNDMLRDASKLRGTLVISGFPYVNDLALAPHIGPFLQDHPDLNVEIEYAPKPHSLALGEADIALRAARPQTGKLMTRKLATFRIGIYQTRGAAPTPRWLGISQTFEQGAIMQFARAHLPGEPTMRHYCLRNLATAMAATGLPGPLPTCIARREPALAPILPDSEFGENGVWLVYHESRRGDPKIEQTIAWLERVFPNPRQCVCGHCS